MENLFPDPAAPMPIISLWQPWASLIAAGFKGHETRHWATGYRGPLAIHAARRNCFADGTRGLCDFAFGPGWQRDLPRGAVVAVCNLVSMHRMPFAKPLSRADAESGNWDGGRYAWRLQNVRALIEPIPLIGRQGLFRWQAPDNLEALLMQPVDQLAAMNRYANFTAAVEAA